MIANESYKIVKHEDFFFTFGGGYYHDYAWKLS